MNVLIGSMPKASEVCLLGTIDTFDSVHLNSFYLILLDIWQKWEK